MPQELEPKQFRFSINGKGFEIDQEPIPVTSSQNGTVNSAVPLTPANFDEFVRKITPVLDGEDK